MYDGVFREFYRKKLSGVSQSFHMRMATELVPETLYFFGVLKCEQSETEEFWV